MRPDPTWTAGPPSTAPGGGLHEAFADRARAHPEAPALIEGARVTTYGRLDATADAWAARLAAAGVAAGSVVPVLLPRGTDLVTALLAVLKTGAAYALLPPDWPDGHLREVVRRLRPPLVVTRPGRPVPGAAAPGWSPPGEDAAAPAGFRPAAVGADAPACVFFTSGTTGRPKGVLSPHRATARLFQPNGFARFTAGTVMPLAAATPWDAFSLELWSVLLNGGTSLVVADPYLSPAALGDAVSRHGADTVWLTSSLFNLVVDEAPEAFGGLRQVLTGGERLSPGHVGRFLRRHPGITLLNGYGPVESTVFATTHRVTEADCDRPGGIPLGRPVPGTRVHVLDGTRPCAVGETGEICLAGDGLALGYLGDPALTDEKFTRITVDGREERVYRTGDLGHWGPDGLLCFGGRADRQVKVRGHRVEPAEVERQVERLLPGVRQCRVLPRDDAARGERQLVAFCVPVSPGDPLDGAPAVLHDALVPYQRPAAVVSVDAFPMTPRGKLDERRLLALAPPAASPVPGGPGVPPDDGVRPRDLADPLERAVAEAFASVLDREAVPVGVPFVRLGGTSLGAGRVCARLSARLSRPVPVAWLHEHPTVTGLARRLAARTPPPAPERTADPAGTPLSSVQLAHLTRTLLDPADRTGHCLLTWVVQGELDPAALRAAIAEVHRRHEALRAAYVLDPRPTARLVDVGPPPLDVLPARSSAEEALRTARAALGDDLAPEEGEVWRTVLVPVLDGNRPGRTAVFGCVVHHVAFDGWSERVLADDLTTGYRTARASGSAVVGPRPSLAALHAVRRERVRQSGADAHRDRLRAELAGVPVLRWPTGPSADAPGKPGHIRLAVSSDAVAGVDAAAAGAGATRFAVLLARWGASLAEVTGQRDFAVGVPVAQRDAPELERAVGCHITMVCPRLRGPALDGGRAAVEATARIAARALAAQDVPFADVLDVAEPPPPGRPPLYQTLFACQDNVPPALDLAPARATFVRQPYLDLPLELHAELWPGQDGGLRLDVFHRPEAVAESTARDVAKLFAERLHTDTSGASS
ncbi:amino acid adenylation domain-containing protein [Streptomyces lavendulocolor]|uniref:amino acid adenylation domain-containing protein n=1 Tax=Streptomyces lavendulocolor TaxID=67316 RepID=UPI0034065D20